MAFLNEERMSKLVQGLRKMFVRSINGQCADAGGDVTIKDYVTGLSVSGKVVTYTKKDGTSGTITTQDTNTDLNPVGAVIAFASSNVPTGYLACSGINVSRTTYKALFNVIGTTYGAGDGSTTFTLPDLTNRFIQCLASNNPVGTVKEAGLPNITGGVAIGGKTSQVATFGHVGAIYGNPNVYGLLTVFSGGTVSTTTGAILIDASKSNPIYGNSTTVQPRSVTMRYCIKY